jgi:hypothetical protein
MKKKREAVGKKKKKGLSTALSPRAKVANSCHYPRRFGSTLVMYCAVQYWSTVSWSARGFPTEICVMITVYSSGKVRRTKAVSFGDDKQDEVRNERTRMKRMDGWMDGCADGWKDDCAFIAPPTE